MKLSKRSVAPEYVRIPHLNKEISEMTHDDLVLDLPIEFPITAYIEEKVDGANMGVSFYESNPILRNREHILKKGYMKTDTPAKQQFVNAWHWLHQHQSDIELVSRQCESPITIYGEWLYAQHSVYYTKLPDLFLAHSIWSVEDKAYLSPKLLDKLLSKTHIKYIKPELVTLNSIDDVITYANKPSAYNNGIREGIVIKEVTGQFCTKMYKVVNKDFMRRTDFNERLLRNGVI